MQKKREVTMADVAALAGVATSTVSRALTDPDKISKKTVAKVLAAAENLGYTPNIMARNFRKGASTSILVVMPEFLHGGVSDVIPQMLQSINRQLMEHGYSIMIANLGTSPQSHKPILDLAFGGTVCGAILLSPTIPEDSGRSLLQATFPMVSTLFDLSEQGIPSVVSDERGIMRRVTLDLHRRGFRHFFYISGPDSSHQEFERFSGVKEAVEQAGADDSELIKFGGQLGYQLAFDIGVQAAEAYLALDAEKSVVLSSSDSMSISFMRTIQKAGKLIPDDVSIVSFDNAPVCEWLAPALSSITFPYNGMAESAVSILLKLIENKNTDVAVRTVLSNRFIERESSQLTAGV